MPQNPQLGITSQAKVQTAIAAPMVAGIISSFIGELLVYPALYFIYGGMPDCGTIVSK